MENTIGLLDHNSSCQLGMNITMHPKSGLLVSCIVGMCHCLHYYT